MMRYLYWVFIEDMLSRQGYSCISANDSQRALELFNQDPTGFDLVVTDQTMPGLTGIDLIEKLRLLRPDLPAILTTGYSDTVNRQQAEQLKVVFMNKPFSREELLHQVHACLLAAAKPES